MRVLIVVLVVVLAGCSRTVTPYDPGHAGRCDSLYAAIAGDEPKPGDTPEQARIRSAMKDQQTAQWRAEGCAP